MLPLLLRNASNTQRLTQKKIDCFTRASACLHQSVFFPQLLTKLCVGRMGASSDKIAAETRFKPPLKTDGSEKKTKSLTRRKLPCHSSLLK